MATVLRASLLAIALLAGCDDHDLRFECLPTGFPGCPAGAECPELPLGSGGCEDLPGIAGHEPIRVQVGRPAGCIAHLPYENPYWGGQMMCTCTRSGDDDDRWVCDL